MSEVDDKRPVAPVVLPQPKTESQTCQYSLPSSPVQIVHRCCEGGRGRASRPARLTRASAHGPGAHRWHERGQWSWSPCQPPSPYHSAWTAAGVGRICYNSAASNTCVHVIMLSPPLAALRYLLDIPGNVLQENVLHTSWRSPGHLAASRRHLEQRSIDPWTRSQTIWARPQTWNCVLRHVSSGNELSMGTGGGGGGGLGVEAADVAPPPPPKFVGESHSSSLLDRSAEYINNHLRAFRAIPWVVGGAGALLFVRYSGMVSALQARHSTSFPSIPGNIQCSLNGTINELMACTCSSV